jgi:hypothetical protein
MPSANLNPQTRFLLLGSSLLAVLLVLWWLALMSPLLFLVRGAVNVCGGVVSTRDAAFSVTVNQSGGWTFEVPVEATLPPSPANPAPRPLHSIGFDMARADAGAFTFGLPVFWALMLAAPGLRRNLRPLLWGTLAMAMLEIALALFTAEILAHVTLARMLREHDPFGHWLLRFGHHLAVDALPYLTPFVVALCAHRELRENVFHWASGAAPVAARNAAISGENKQSRRPRPNKTVRRRN